MQKVEIVHDIYPAIDELIKLLAKSGTQHISKTLYHRIYKVSWTCQSELFEELSHVFENILNDDSDCLDHMQIDQITKIKKIIDESIETQP